MDENASDVRDVVSDSSLKLEELYEIQVHTSFRFLPGSYRAISVFGHRTEL
jgi:hypothetical protein